MNLGLLSVIASHRNERDVVDDYWSRDGRPQLLGLGIEATGGPKQRTVVCGIRLLGICFWRKVREERVWTEFIGEKGGYGADA